ncbi:MAG TPA: DUF5916 domain-containing protein [Terriglobia bacterium]|nr:DUF5916 domain-containing protein [Terriglobia bacterium]
MRLGFVLCVMALITTLCAGLRAYGLTSQSRSAIGTGPQAAHAVRVEHPPRLDGTLNDPQWQAAEPVRDFHQREPYDNQVPTEQTEVRILYTRHEVYFGVLCRDSDPKGIVATELRRDLPQYLDDYFEISIDPTYERRNAYVFQINPLGTQADGTITEEQQSGDQQDFDPGWDGVWSAQARINAQGWTATVGIPFSTLNFMKTKDVIWGLNFKRFIRRKNEEDLWRAWRREFGISKVSQEGELVGITDIGSGRLFFLQPYGLMGSDHLSTSPGTDFLHTGGLDIKYGLRSNLVANLTANTDFGDADVDQLQFNLTPFKLFFPEKRRFFLENAGTFSFPMGQQDLLFFSRQIGIDPVTGEVVPIDAGGKVTGTLGDYDVGVMDVQTRSDGPNPSANYAVVRAKRSLFGNSYVGLLGVDKESGDAQDPFNRTGGVDTRLVFHKNLVIHAYATAAGSHGVSGPDSDIGADVSYITDWMQFQASQDRVGPNFNPEVGFVNRTDINESFADLTLAPRPKLPGVRELNFEGFIDHVPDTHGVFQTQEWQGTFRALFNNGSYTDDDIYDTFTQRLSQPFNLYKNISIPPGIYHFARHQLTYGSRQDRRFTWSLFERFGTYYSGHLNEARVRTTYRASSKFSLSTTTLWDRFRLPHGNFSVALADLGANYSFSRFLTTSTLIQVDTSNTQAVSANFRLRYQFRHDDPFSNLFIIYNTGTRFSSLSGSNLEQLREDRFEVKLTYSFTPSLKQIREARRAPVGAE